MDGYNLYEGGLNKIESNDDFSVESEKGQESIGSIFVEEEETDEDTFWDDIT